MTRSSNLFADLRQQMPDALITTLLEAANIRIERIVSHGQASPEGFWYDQDQHEWVIVLKGAARAGYAWENSLGNSAGSQDNPQASRRRKS